MRLVLYTLAALLTAPAFASADHQPECSTDGNVALGILEFGGGDASSTFYVDDRNLPLGNGVWLYQESNGVYAPGGSAVENLQTGGSSVLLGDLDVDPCMTENAAGPDTLIV